MRVLVYGMSGEIYGGIESFLMNMNEHMSVDCVFDYVIVGDKCMHTERIKARGGQVYTVTSYKKNPIKFLMDSWRTAKQAKRDHKAAYFNLFSMCHIAPVLISRLMGYHIVLHAHNNNIPNKSLLYHLLHRFDRWLLSGMNCTRLTNSEASGIFMFGKKYSDENGAELVYNAIDVQQFQFDHDIRKQKRAELRIEGKNVIGYAGRLSAEKNIGFLLDIFTEIYQRDRNAALLIAGEGNQRTLMEQKLVKLGLHGSVIFLGGRNDMAELYQAMDAFVLPSLFEGLGIVLVEAQAAGLKCFASAGVIPSIVQISEDILNFMPLEMPAGAWAELILQEVCAPLDREHWNHVLFESKFNIHKEALHLEKILRESCSRRRSYQLTKGA